MNDSYHITIAFAVSASPMPVLSCLSCRNKKDTRRRHTIFYIAKSLKHCRKSKISARIPHPPPTGAPSPRGKALVAGATIVNGFIIATLYRNIDTGNKKTLMAVAISVFFILFAVPAVLW